MPYLLIVWFFAAVFAYGIVRGGNIKRMQGE